MVTQRSNSIDMALGRPEPRAPHDLFMDTIDSECRARRMRFMCVDERGIRTAMRDAVRMKDQCAIHPKSGQKDYALGRRAVWLPKARIVDENT